MIKTIIFPDRSYTFSQYLITRILIAVSQEVNNLEHSVVVQTLELAINLALYGFFYKVFLPTF